MVWHFGNTSVRSALRLREGLIALQDGNLEGRIRDGDGDERLRRALGQRNIVSLGSDVTNSVGRKWRSALEKMGFIYPNLPARLNIHSSYFGKQDYITKSGHRLLASDNLKGQQECFLRALLVYTFQDEDDVYYPFKFVLSVMSELQKTTPSSRLSKIEMAVIVQCTLPSTTASSVAKDVLSFRAKRKQSANKNHFDRDEYTKAHKLHDLKEGTFKDYADSNFRYLKASGMVGATGRGITLVADKTPLIQILIAEPNPVHDEFEVIKSRCEGATLPTDDYPNATKVLQEQVERLRDKGVKFSWPAAGYPDVQSTQNAIHKVEEQLFELTEIDYAARQKYEIEEISGYLSILMGDYQRRNSHSLSNGTTITVPKGEAPAYFEWAIWRAFLAINSIVTPPSGARRFGIDQDMLPTSTAPGGGADLVIEFDNLVLVIEVTLTQSSRQEAAEGEPVRRHVAQVQEKFLDTDKEVFGLFIAVKIDTNTANTFRIGEWYDRNDSKLDLKIVPLQLLSFQALLDASNGNPSALLQRLHTILVNCRSDAKVDAPQWKASIDRRIDQTLASINRL
jgi:hypothetical protein